MTTDLVVVFSPVGGGHKSAALATAEAARARGLRVEVLDMFEHAPRCLGETYVATHLTGQAVAPNFYGSVYFAANRRGGALEPVRRAFDHVAFAGLVDRVVALAPRAVVATHHLPLVVLGRARRQGRLDAPLFGVVTDYTAHAAWAEKGVDAFGVPCALAMDELEAHGVARSRITLTGIPVRAAFGRVPNALEPRGTMRVLVTSGGSGVGPMRAIVRSFAGVRDVQLTVVCGAARDLVPQVERVAVAAGVRARILGFESDMPSRMAEANLVVGKAGGLTVSESLTAGRPMILVGAVPGNEKLNERYVVQGGAGYASLPENVGKLADAMRGAGVLSMRGERARRLVVQNAAERVLDAVFERVQGDRRSAA